MLSSLSNDLFRADVCPFFKFIQIYGFEICEIYVIYLCDLFYLYVPGYVFTLAPFDRYLIYKRFAHFRLFLLYWLLLLFLELTGQFKLSLASCENVFSKQEERYGCYETVSILLMIFLQYDSVLFLL